MRRLVTRWVHRSDEVRRRAWSAGGAFLAVAIGSGLLAAGCVSREAYFEVEERNEQLEDRLVRAERSTESLSAERLDLVGRTEDLTLEVKRLSGELKALQAERDQFATELSDHRDELAARSHEVESLRSTYDGLIGDLEAEVSAGQMEIERLRDGFEVNVSDQFLFDKGRADLKPSGREVLQRLAEEFSRSSGQVEVVGHTDNAPIRGTLSRKFPTNWELGAARAAAVVRFFEEYGVSEARLSVISQGSGRPLVPNDSEENRGRNRRIEIRVIPDGAEKGAEESPAAPPDAEAGR